MKEVWICPNCQNIIDENTDICPNCHYSREKQVQTYPKLILFSQILKVLSICAIIYGLVYFIHIGDTSGLSEFFDKLTGSLYRLFVNTYDYYFNINFTNNTILRLLSILKNNIMNLIDVIITNIKQIYIYIWG